MADRSSGVCVLGLDTGGTFTDAAIVDTGTGKVLAKAKSATTRHDLSVGLGRAINAALDAVTPKQRKRITRVCLSTTLATNAVVEGMGGRVGLVMIGFDEAALGRNNLGTVLGGDPVAFVAGGHESDGRQQSELDTGALSRFAGNHRDDIGAIAIAGHFAVRNPEHEIAARDLLRGELGLPVTCSHELSSELGGPKRALTALLNSRLIDLLDRQIEATDAIIADAGLDAEQMVVKGDGSLVSAEFARLRPVETILSGPAASLSGAAHLVGKPDAVVADIGGTTTDIAILEDGLPRLSPKGASVGGWSTMVEAADIRTGGLGGDSEVRLIDRGTKGGVMLGPRRVVPLAAAASDHPGIVPWLEEQARNPVPSGLDARFVLPLFEGEPPNWLTRSEAGMARRSSEAGIAPLADIAQTRLAIGAVDRLVARGLLAVAAFTPTDAILVLERFEGVGGGKLDRGASLLGAELMARQRNGAGRPQAEDGGALSRMALERLTVQTSLALLDSVFAHQGMGEGRASGNDILETMVVDAGRTTHGGTPGRAALLVGTDIRLKRPLIALGASAACHYPPVARVLGAELTVPEDADVAGAIGAAAGSIRQRASVTVTQPTDGIFRVHGTDGPHDFDAMEAALDFAEGSAREEAGRKAEAAGADDITLTADRQVKLVPVGGDKELFVEATVHAFARDGNRPRHWGESRPG